MCTLIDTDNKELVHMEDDERIGRADIELPKDLLRILRDEETQPTHVAAIYLVGNGTEDIKVAVYHDPRIQDISKFPPAYGLSVILLQYLDRLQKEAIVYLEQAVEESETGVGETRILN